MQKEKKELIKDIIRFLGFFDLYLPFKDKYDLIEDLFFNKGIDVLDINENIVGSVIKNEDSILIQVKNNDKLLKGVFRTKIKNNKKFRKAYFFITDKNNKSLKGHIEFIRSKETENLFFEGKYYIFNGKTEVVRSKFATYNNMVNLTDAISGEYINYSSKKEDNFKQSELFHKKKDITLNVICDLDNIYYKIRRLVEEVKFEDGYSINDNRYSYNGYEMDDSAKLGNYELVEEEIRKVFQEYDPEIFDFIQIQKDALNYFGNSLFEKIFSAALYRLNKKSRMNIFGIDDSYKDSSYKK